MKNFDKKTWYKYILFIVGKVYNRSRDCKFESQLSHITFVEIGHEIFSTVILPSCWFKKGSCQLLAKVCAQVLFDHLEDLAWPRKVSTGRLTDWLNMTLTVDWATKCQLKLKFVTE